jgi:ribonuclease BN (tRNA processing enzyme)
MKLRVLGAYGSEGVSQRPSSFLINGKTLIDAGCTSSALTVSEQLHIEHALISHTHLDHVAGLAFLTETMALSGHAPSFLTISSIDSVVKGLRSCFFSGVVWPDFTKIPTAKQPVVKFRDLEENAEQQVGDLMVRPVSVSHTVPAAGFIVHDGSNGLVYSGDTGPTHALWKAARNVGQIDAVILECSYPNRFGWVAKTSKHMTPELVERELDKLPSDATVFIFHIKPQFYEETADELNRINSRQVVIVEQDKTYDLD